MAGGKLKLAWVEERKKRQSTYQKMMRELMKEAEELTILCDARACLTFYNPVDGKLVVWPSLEEAKFLIERFNALPENERNENAHDVESYIKANTEMIEQKLENSRKSVEELKMEQLMLQLENGRMLADLSQTEVEKLMSYAGKKIAFLKREIRMRYPDASGNEAVLGDDDDQEKETYEGESSKSGGADDA